MSTAADERPGRRERLALDWPRLLGICAIAAAVALSYHLFFLNTPDRWWMDDDSRNFATAGDVENPASFFVDRAVARNFSVTTTINPMLGLSIWLDTRFAHPSFRFAQMHNAVILAATLCLLFLVLRKWGLGAAGASAVCVLWLFLPATVVVSGWLAARHHFQGFTWTLAAVLVAQKLVQREWREDTRSIGLLLLFLAFAALSKETYALTVPLGISLYLWYSKRTFAASCCGALFLVYVGYRSCLVGFTAGGGYYDSLPSAFAFMEFLARLPYIFTANAGGYLLMVIAVAPLAVLYRQHRLDWRAVLSVLAVIASALVVVYRGALPLHRDWLDPGTWYRLVYFLGSGLLVGAACLIARVPAPRLAYVAAGVALPIVIAGGVTTEKRWRALSNRYEVEGKFYLKYPDRLVYSELPAGWYLDGIQRLYRVAAPHHVVAGHEQTELAQRLAGHSGIWRYVNGKFVNDRQLFQQLKREAEGAASGQ